MLLVERHVKIVELVRERSYVSVEELAQLLDVSAMTIRRDLASLSSDGVIQRCHGGATVKGALVSEWSYTTKSAANREAKAAIARRAAELVNPNDSVFLDSGTTNYETAILLSKMKGLTVITNDVLIGSHLLKSDVQLILTGGVVQKSTASMIGRFTEHFLEEVRVEIAFIGAASIDNNYDLYTPTPEKAFVKRAMLQISNKKYLVADASKFYKQSMIRIGNLADFSGVITDKSFNPAERKKLAEKHISVIAV